jgi:hypothetical protein
MTLGRRAEQSQGVPVVKRNEIAKVGVDTPPLIFCNCSNQRSATVSE